MLRDLQPMMTAMRVAGVDPKPLLANDTAHLVAYGQDVVSLHEIPGINLTAARVDGEIRVNLIVRKWVDVEQPVHLCLGLFEPTGEQKIRLAVWLEPNSRASFIAHCLFTRPRSASHQMQADFTIGTGAELRYTESHSHGDSGGMDVRPTATIHLGRDARMFSDFSLISGRVGLLDIDYDVDVGENAVAEFTSKVYGRGTDQIRIRERLVLSGTNARGLIKSRIAATDDAVAEIIGMTEGNAAGARGHVDCMEIVRDRARVSANPMVKVSHPQAKVTHEAAIGSVDHQQLETLMARGLSPDAAVDLIVSGILRNA